MDVGIQMVLATYGWQGMSDDQAWDEEIRLARLADEFGFAHRRGCGLATRARR